jgi:catechol 2,3-dioxygenase-like lactoylglutathione lyase family enzyme
MKRLHIHVAVDDLDTAIGFYSTLFASEPDVVKPDYAKWMLDDPRVNFAISHRGAKTGLNHLGIQVESEAELGRSTVASRTRTGRCWRKARPCAATPGRRRRGSTIRLASHGRHS